jgi:hypothetical protein
MVKLLPFSDAMWPTSSCSALCAQPLCKESHGLSEDEREVEEPTTVEID